MYTVRNWNFVLQTVFSIMKATYFDFGRLTTMTKFIKINLQDSRDNLAVKSTYYSSREPEYGSLHSHHLQSSQVPRTPVPEDPMPPVTCAHECFT